MDASIDEFNALVMEFERSPSADILKRLEVLWRQIQSQLRTAGTDLAVAALRRSVSALVSALSSPAAAGDVPAGVIGAQETCFSRPTFSGLGQPASSPWIDWRFCDESPRPATRAARS